MSSRGLTKALVLQGLFFCALLQAQTLELLKPLPGEALLDHQEFILKITGDQPERVLLYLNDRLILARRQAPFRFQVRWNTKVRNRVRFEALYSTSDPIVMERDFQEITTDIETSVQAFQCFPFLDGPLRQPWRLRFNGNRVAPQVFEPANKFRLNFIIVLDLSGSMKFSLEEISAPLLALLDWIGAQYAHTRVVLFDRTPRAIPAERLPDSLITLYKGEAKSIVWDAVVTAATLFDAGPRRVLFLISDGADDGSEHDPGTVESYLKRTGASLIWLSPVKRGNRELARLVDLSGGFILDADRATDPWSALRERLANQHHLLAPDVSYPIKIEVPSRRVWYPAWKR